MDTDTLVAANEQEDKLIARLEKKLGLKKRKNLPSKFKEDGFDCILLRFSICTCIWPFSTHALSAMLFKSKIIKVLLALFSDYFIF